MAERGHRDDDEAPSFLDNLISQETRRRTREQTQPIIDACVTPGCLRTSVVIGCVVALLITTLIIIINQTNQTIEDIPIIRSNDPPYYMLEKATQQQIQTHMRYLSSYEVEGRAPGTRGEILATSYISSHFQAAGLKSFNITELLYNSTETINPDSFDPYIQKVPMIGSTVRNASSIIIFNNTQEDVLAFRHLYDFTIESEDLNAQLTLDKASIVFAGNCVFSPRLNINDFKGLDIGGKIVICLNADQLNTTIIDKDFFGDISNRLTYMRAQGVKGVFFLFSSTNPSHSPWTTYVNRFGIGEQIYPYYDAPLSFRGWIQESTVAQLARLHHYTLEEWINYASYSYFRPIELQVTLSLSVNFTKREFDARNVVGFLGPDPRSSVSSSSIVVFAHHDSLGIRHNPYPLGPSGTFSGAIDSVSGVATLLSTVSALSALYTDPYVVTPDHGPPTLEKSIIFVTYSGSENMAGLLYFFNNGKHICHSEHCNARLAVNFNIMNVWGKTTSAVVLGKSMNKLVSTITDKSISAEGMHLKVSSKPLSRRFPWLCVRMGIPSIVVSSSRDSDPDPLDTYQATLQYTPYDVLSTEIKMDGMVQQVRLALRIVFSAAISTESADKWAIDNPQYMVLV